MRILLIVQPERFDFYNYLNAIPNAEWFLLWYEKPGQMSVSAETLPISFKQIFHWTQFSTPNNLFKKIKPDRIIFFEIIDLRQIALIVSARYKNIPTFYVEHGAAGSPETAKSRWNEITVRQHKIPYYVQRFTKKFGDVVKAKAFYYAVRKGFRSGSSYRKFLLLPIKMMKDAPNKVLAYNCFPERVPHKCIVFNKVNYDEFELYTGVSTKDSVFTGIPYFDKYHRDLPSEKNYVVYIDSPYYEENLVGWTKEHHNRVSNVLFTFAEENKTRVYVKLHPRSDLSLWNEKTFNKDYVTIIQHGDYTELFLEAKLIMGFSSSLMTGFLCARKNIVFLGWHTEPQIFGADFSKTGLCHRSMCPEELLSKYEYWKSHNLTKENEEAYQAFLHQFNYPFDGKATQRVIKAITENEIR